MRDEGLRQRLVGFVVFELAEVDCPGPWLDAGFMVSCWVYCVVRRYVYSLKSPLWALMCVSFGLIYFTMESMAGTCWCSGSRVSLCMAVQPMFWPCQLVRVPISVQGQPRRTSDLISTSFFSSMGEAKNSCACVGLI